MKNQGTIFFFHFCIPIVFPARIFTMCDVFIIERYEEGICNSGFYLFIELIKQIMAGTESVSYLQVANDVA